MMHFNGRQIGSIQGGRSDGVTGRKGESDKNLTICLSRWRSFGRPTSRSSGNQCQIVFFGGSIEQL